MDECSIFYYTFRRTFAHGIGSGADLCDRSGEHVDRVLAVLASSDGEPLSIGEIEPLTEGLETTVRQACKALFEAGVVRRENDGRSHQYALDEDFLERRIQVAEQQVG